MPFRLKDVTALLAATATALMVGGAIAGEWLVDGKTGCRIWNGFPEPGESMSWDGPCDNGFANGKGTLQDRKSVV